MGSSPFIRTNQKGDDHRSSPFWFDVILKMPNPLLLLATATICARAGYIITCQHLYRRRRRISLIFLRFDDIPKPVADDIQGLLLDWFVVAIKTRMGN